MDRYGLDTSWLRFSKEAIAEGKSIIMYPEGRTGKEFEPREFKSGFIMLAISAKATIVPYATNGKYSTIFGKRTRVLVGTPTELTAENKGLRPAYLEAESERFRQLVIDLRKQIKGEQQ